MERAASANGEAVPHGAANEGRDAEDTPANQQRDEELGAANGSSPLKGLSNEGKRSCSSANEGAEPQELTNDSKEPQPTNEDRAHKAPTNEDREHKAPTNEDREHRAPTNEDREHKAPTNEDAGHKSPLNKDTAPQALTNQGAAPRAAANQDSSLQPPANQALPHEDTPPHDPTNDLAALPETANGARDPWDWSLEEAWLRAPEEEEFEEWWAEPEGWGEEPGEDEEAEEGFDQWWSSSDGAWSEACTDQWQPSPDGAWSKLLLRPGRGLARPGPGSLCRVLLTVPSSVPAGWGALSPACGANCWVSLRLGTAEGRWACAVDAILETMTAGERSRLRPTGATAAAVTVHLGRFTPAPPFWEMPPTLRWRSVTSGHARAAALLSRGLLGPAGRAYSRALRTAVAAAGPPPFPPEVTAVKAELHAGLALVQLQLGLPAAAAANAGKALALRPAHLEARYRRGLAQAAMMDLEAAMADLVAVLRAQPGHAGARRELRRVRVAVRERDARLARRLGRLFA